MLDDKRWLFEWEAWLRILRRFLHLWRENHKTFGRCGSIQLLIKG